jgi:hypothetical protein
MKNQDWEVMMDALHGDGSGFYDPTGRRLDKYGRPAGQQQLGDDGRPITRTKRTHPYSYEAFLVWGTPWYRMSKEDRAASDAVYDDRMRQWDYEKYESAQRQAFTTRGSFSQCSPAEIEKFLQLYYSDHTIKLLTLLEGCNVSNGYPYWVFRFTSDGIKARAAERAKQEAEKKP